MRKLLLLILLVGGCGSSATLPTQSTVDPRCKAGAPCEIADMSTAYAYFEQNVLSQFDKAALRLADDPNATLQQLFTNWYFTGTK